MFVQSRVIEFDMSSFKIVGSMETRFRSFGSTCSCN